MAYDSRKIVPATGLTPAGAEPTLVEARSAAAFFQDLVHEAAEARPAPPSPEAEFYLVDLLGRSVRSDAAIHDETPLAELYLRAHDAGPCERDELLRRVGDRALFLAGVVPESLARRLVGVAYFARIGRIAYAELAEDLHGTRSGVTRGELFSELADHFAEFVGILAEVSEQALGNARRCLLSVCEKWLATGSPSTAQRIRREGLILPSGPLPRLLM